MWIELQDDINDILEQIQTPMDERAIAINDLWNSMLKSHHLIYAKRGVLQRLLKYDYIDPKNKSLIKWILEKYLYLYPAEKIVNKKIIITANDLLSVDKDIYYVPLLKLKEYRETRLLTENESDADCFMAIFNKISKTKHLSEYGIDFEKNSFHGANVETTIEQNVIEDRVVLCIVDSDKDYQGGASGSTSQKAHQVWNRVKDDHIIGLYELGVREKENLFSPNLYLHFCRDKKDFLLAIDRFNEDENIIRFFDIKDGVRHSYFADEKWERIYRSLIDEFKKSGAYTEPSQKERIKANKDKKSIDGIGGRVCEAVVKAYLLDESQFVAVTEQYGIRNDDLQVVREKRNNVFDYISDYILEEWEALFNIMFDWGCCLPKCKLPIHISA